MVLLLSSCGKEDIHGHEKAVRAGKLNLELKN